MGFLELFLIGVGLSMDAFAVAICQGLSMTRIKWGHALTVGLQNSPCYCQTPHFLHWPYFLLLLYYRKPALIFFTLNTAMLSVSHVANSSSSSLLNFIKHGSI